MPEIMIRNIPVQFPFEPYDVQRAYMEKVIDCLQSGAHGMLESPTGTGKTLSLLCATLAWLNIKKAQTQAMRMTKEDNPFLDDLKDSLNSVAGSTEGNQSMSWGRLGPKIIYASRTHSQLTQAISEMRRTSYAHMRMAVIGSRDQLCTHPEVSKEENSAVKTSMCQALLASRSCYLQRNVEKRRDDVAFSEAGVMDIEDLIKVSAPLRVCPYYMSRELKQSADIIFMPYNYLLDPRTRRQQDMEMNNSIVILDEGHNVEKICEDSASYSITSTDVAMCIGEVTEVMKMFSSSETMFDFNDDSDKKRDFTENELMLLKEMLLKLEKVIDEIPLMKKKDSSEAAFPGEYIFEILSKASVTQDSQKLFAAVIESIVQYLSAMKNSQAAGSGPFQKTGGNLEKLANFFKTVYHFERKSYDEHVISVRECYKVFVTLEQPKPTFKKNSWASVKEDTKPGGKIVNFWCFNPGYGMQGLLNLGVHSIIVTSGTLSPLGPLISELGIPINITLENKHVISKDQVFVSVVSCGPDKEPLISTYTNRSNSKYITSLGRTIVNFARIVPEGLLVFFPSYGVLDQCKQHWEGSGIWSQICNIKEIFVEPRGKRDLNDVMNAYYSRIVQPGSKGACFLAVCRGKVSEGLDFADHNGRAVILTGLPYPPYMDPKVVMKREYLDKNKKKVTGANWYQLEATRAVNQAVGRVIRHRNDYGAVLFCDSRFAQTSNKQQMSAWLRPYIQTPSQFGDVTRGLCQFFKNAKRDLPQPGKKEMSAAWGEASLEPATPSKAVPAFFDTTSKWINTRDKVSEKHGKGNFRWNSGQQPSTPLNSMSSYSQQSSGSAQKKSISKSMFGALEETVQVIDFNSVEPTTDDSSTSTLADCTNKGDTPSRLESDEQPPDAKRRKLKVMGVKLNYEQTDPCCSSTPATPANSKKSQMIDYLKLVKRHLSHKDMQIFNAAVMEYSRKSDYAKLVDTLTSLFNKPSLYMCIRGFDACIKDFHKEQFALLCKEKYNA